MFWEIPKHDTQKENVSLKEVTAQIRNERKRPISFWVQG